METWNNKRLKKLYETEKKSFIEYESYTEEELTTPYLDRENVQDNYYLYFRRGLLFGIKLADVSLRHNKKNKQKLAEMLGAEK